MYQGGTIVKYLKTVQYSTSVAHILNKKTLYAVQCKPTKDVA